jgi:flagellar biosynthesis protein FlhA
MQAVATFSQRIGLTPASGRDLGLAFGIIAIIAMLIVPLPPLLLDLGLAVSITVSVLIMMTALFIERPLQLSSFPTILLIATMLRLGLNLASTRLILAEGHTGAGAAGGIIEAFGTFLMGGNAIIGITVFLILIVINFVVITKGAGRIAEVAARFSLDAMPGKQMAIDADLSSGLIDEKEARRRRTDLEAESGFYGAMDGASKFVRGDAVAGLVITAINILVGLIVGTASHGVDIATAFTTYTTLTVGDGLVSQIPALIVSTAAGILVTKGGTDGKTEAQLVDQLTRYPKAVGMAAGLLGALALMPGLPFLPFAALAGISGYGAHVLARRQHQQAIAEAEAIAVQAEAATAAEEPIQAVLAIDQVRIELGLGLLGLVNDSKAEVKVTDQVRALRRQLASDFGFVMPSVRILDNLALPTNSYRIFVKETEAGRGELRPDRLLVMHPEGRQIALPGEETTEPAFGMAAKWVDRSEREEANVMGLTVVDAATVITTHLTEVVKDNIADLLSYAETQKLLDDLPGDARKLVSDIVPAKASVSTIQRILQSLLTEAVSIRDLATILEGIAEATGFTSNIVTMTEHVRARLARQISAANSIQGAIPIATLSPDWEERFATSLVGNGEDRQLAMAPSQLQAFIQALRDGYDRFAATGDAPVLLTSPGIRPFVRSIVERFRPATVVLSQSEIHPKARIRALGSI